MKKKWILVAGLATVVVIIGITGCQSGDASLRETTALNVSNQQQGIWVTGQGKVVAVPDIATIRLGIDAKDVSVADAQVQVTTAMNEVLKTLGRAGVAAKDIQTQHFSIQKVTRWDRSKEENVITGYRVTNIVTAKVRDIDKAGSTIDDVAKAGGDLIRIDSIEFTVEDQTGDYQKAREAAIVDAATKAKQLAGLTGVSLGKVTYISESSFYAPIVQRAAFAREETAIASTTINPGELEISLDIQVAYDIK